MKDSAKSGGAMNHGAAGDGTGGTGGLPGTPGAPGHTSGPRQGWVLALVCGALPAALAAVIVGVPAALWSRLPARVADHWTLTGTANGTAPRLVPFLLLGVIALPGAGMAWLGWAATRKGPRDGVPRPADSPGPAGTRAAAGARGRAPTAGTAAAVVAAGLFMMAISAGAVIMVVVANLGGGLRPASVGPGPLPGLVGGSAVLAFFGGYVLRHYAKLAGTDDGARSSLGLRPGERAVWTGRARAVWAWPAAVLLAAAGALAGSLAGQWGPAAALVAAGILMTGFTSVRVTVAARGLTVGYGPLGPRLTRIPLRRIASAAAVERTSLNFGYRGSLLVFGAAAVALRRGPALRLSLRDGKTFLVTVDDAETGAALLNDLIAAG